IKIFIGNLQTKVPIDLVLKSQELHTQIEWIQINGTGKNALDFHLTFMLGRLVEKDPNACFHVISKDTGYDHLINHLKFKNILCSRKEDIAKITTLIQEGNKSLEDSYEAVMKKLEAVDKKNRPKSEATLKNHIRAHLKLHDGDIVINDIFQKLLSSKKISIDQAKVIDYSF
ncbi:MAG: PIN domain-containing protein, partial [Pseudanabaena sp.]